VRESLGRLPHADREILVLRDYHELSYREISDVLSIPVGTVMSRLHRARRRMRDRLDRAGLAPRRPS
jgi:RNA polymerase sigma-70 factor (ECF subfamily)